MEPDVIRMYSSSPPPMEDGVEEDDDEFGDFDTFSAVSTSVSFSEFDIPSTFNQTQGLAATSPPELPNAREVVGLSHSASNGTHSPPTELSKANGVVPGSHVGGPSDRTDTKRVISRDSCVSATPSDTPAVCNGGMTEVLTNGFASFDIQGSPSIQSCVHGNGTPSEDNVPAGSPEDEFADFAAFSDAECPIRQTADEDLDNPTGGEGAPAEVACDYEQRSLERKTPSEGDVRDASRTGPITSVPTDVDRPSHTDLSHECSTSEAVCTKSALVLNGGGGAEDDSKDGGGCSESDLSPDAAGQSDGKSSETETSLGRPLSTDALEEYGDMSTTGSVPSPPLQEESATPADHSQLVEDDEDFGDFGDVESFSSQGFAAFDRPDVQQEVNSSHGPAQVQHDADDDDFGDFNYPKFNSGVTEEKGGATFSDFPVSDSFGNFSSAVGGEDGEVDAGWSAFGEPQVADEEEQREVEGESWAAFGSEDSAAATPAGGMEDKWHEGEAASVSEELSRTERQAASLSSRLEKLFQSSFPQTNVPLVADEVASLETLLEDKPPSGAEGDKSLQFKSTLCGGVWTQLQDIHEALGLRHQWGGSYCNKALLCCLGIDTRNILFTGQKKQPVIVPMYAASLGMLEPTKEPVKPVSAAEMIASIAQAPPLAPEKSSCPSDVVQQEALPPVQFDWSSSGLTNPLDASGGSFLLNLDFFGPVEDSGSTSSPAIPGVDPELFELTTAKMDPGSSGSRVADAFARLMSTMEKTSTSTRKPRKDENLSEEASKVIAALPDLSFMQAKVLMFPATLTPLGSQATPE